MSTAELYDLLTAKLTRVANGAHLIFVAASCKCIDTAWLEARDALRLALASIALMLTIWVSLSAPQLLLQILGILCTFLLLKFAC